MFFSHLPVASLSSCRRAFGLATVLLIASSCIAAAAQGPLITYAHKADVQGFRGATGIAADASGNIVVADSLAGILYKESPNGDGTYTQTAIATVAAQPVSVAIDAANNLYVDDAARNTIYKETFSGGVYSESVVASGFVAAHGITVDASGDVFVLDWGAGSASSGRVLLEKLTGGSYVQTVVATGLNFSSAGSIAADRAGNVYVAEFASGRILKEILDNDIYSQSIALPASPATSNLAAVQVDKQGHLFILSQSTGLFKAVPSNGTYAVAPIFVGGNSGPLTGNSLAFDVVGNFYVTNGSAASIFAANELGESSSSLAFGSVTAGTTTPSQTAIFTFDVGGTLATTPYAVSTQGDLTLDFQPAPTQATTVCMTGKTYQAGDTCTVAATFTPRQPGARYGAIVLFAPSGAPIATSYMQGVGVAPQVSFSPGQVSISIGDLFSRSVATDASGRYAYASSGHGLSLGSYPVTEPSLDLVSGFTTGYVGPTAFPVDASQFADGLAVDGAGNIVLSDGYTSVVTTGMTSFSAWDLNPTLPVTDPTKFAGVYGTAYLGATPITRAIQLPGNTRPAIDGAGNLFFADDDGDQILQLHYVHGGYNSQTVVATGLSDPGDVVVDSAGAVYAADTGNNRIVKETPNSDGTYTQSVVDSGFTPAGLAIDRLGNLYASQFSTSPSNPPSVLKEVLSSNGYTRTPLSLLGDLGVDVDPAGNVFAVQLGQSINIIEALDVSTPPSYNFAATAVGTTSSDSPKLLTVANNGNAPLHFTGVALSAGYSLASASTCPSVGATGALAPGASCTFLINFAPLQSGYTNGTLTLTDDHRGTLGATQVIELSGQGTGGGTAAVSLTPATYNYGSVNIGSSAAQTFTLTNSGSGAVALTSTSLSNAVFSTSSTTCAATVAAGSSCGYTIVFQPVAAGAQTATFSVADAAGTQTASLMGVGAAAPTAALTPATSNFGTVAVGASSAAMTFTLVNTGNAALAITSFGIAGTGSASFQLGSGTCGSSLAAGSSCTLLVTCKPVAAGTLVAQLTVTDAVGAQSANLSGVGSAAAAPQALLTPAAIDFGSIAQGISASAKTLTLSNTGNATLAIGTIALTGANSSGFAIATNSCGSSLAAGSSCAIQVTFTPTAVSAATASLTVTDAVGVQSSTLSGDGLALSFADFTLAASPTTQSAYQGTAVSYTVSLASADTANPFTSLVDLRVTGLPSGSTASFSPASATPGLGATAKLIVRIAPLTAKNTTPARRMVQTGVLLCALLPMFSSRSKRLRAGLLVAIVVILTASLSGCGLGNGFAIPSSTYNLVVSGTSGTLAHTTQVSLVVK